jgi:hypothetical protein
VKMRLLRRSGRQNREVAHGDERLKCSPEQTVCYISVAGRPCRDRAFRHLPSYVVRPDVVPTRRATGGLLVAAIRLEFHVVEVELNPVGLRSLWTARRRKWRARQPGRLGFPPRQFRRCSQRWMADAVIEVIGSRPEASASANLVRTWRPEKRM